MSLIRRLAHRVIGGVRPDAGRRVAVTELGAPAGPVYAVGDAHGCLALYREIEARIVQDAAAFDGPPTLVLLGDMIDRGPHSAELIDHLMRPPPGALRRHCLMGNHEEMMLDYLADARAHAGWLHAGGSETLASYGIRQEIDELERMAERKLRQTLAAHLPEGHVAFLQGLLPGICIGGYLLAHAGADATAPLSAQPRRALLWGDAGERAPMGLTLVRGHVVVAAPDRRAGLIGIDTGAYATGRLTALRLVPGQEPAVLTTRQGDQFTRLDLRE